MAATDYDFNSTRNEIIERALRIVGALSTGETVSAEMVEQGRISLNHLVKTWQSDNLFLWTLVPQTQALTATVASYSLPTDPAVIAIDKAYLRISNNDTPVEVISYRNYIDIPNKTDPGDPVAVTVNNAISPTMYVYPVPATSRTLYYLAIVKLKDMDTAAGNANFPTQYLDALVYGLAANLADEYGLPISERELLVNKARQFYAVAKKSNRDRSDYEFVDGAF